jgi:dTDP-4-dehydrorhamnose reductase
LRGVCHMTKGRAVSWIELARLAAVRAGLDPTGLREQKSADCHYAAPRPTNSALDSGRAILLPTLDDALSRFLAHRTRQPELTTV